MNPTPAASPDEWGPRLADLVDTLTEQDDLRSPAWIEVFSSIPRHLFTPEIIISTGDGYRTLPTGHPADTGEWLDAVYSDDSLVTQHLPHAAGYRLPSGEPLQVPTSSSTMPSLMARMLEALDLADGMRVLEIGTGTGYNAALLSERLGGRNVVSIDIDPHLVEAARTWLAALGHTPTLIAGDGTHGAPDHAPFDRIIATAAVPDIPTAWIHQLAPGGKILANLRGDLAGATCCLLTKDSADDEVIGPVLPLGGHFMWLRPDPADPHRPHEHPMRDQRAVSRTTTSLDPTDIPLDDDGFRFLLQLDLHGIQTLWRGTAHDPTTRTDHDAVIATATDGSRAEAFTTPHDDGTHRILQSGPRTLWPAIEAAHRR
ncbi:MAG: methyltransferase domain-containing protein [Pseudonocardia sp.]